MEHEAKKPGQARESIGSALKDTAGRGQDINEPGNQMLLRRLGQTQAGSPGLEQVIKGRLREMYDANQIPAAEREADRIASSVSGANTPEDVKEELGARMGADFSGVEFHVDAEAANRAGNIGAKAYTVGETFRHYARLWQPASSSRRAQVRSRLNEPVLTRPSWNGLICCTTY